MKLDKTEKRILTIIVIVFVLLIYLIIGSIIQSKATYECRTQGYEVAVIDLFTHETQCKYPMYIKE